MRLNDRVINATYFHKIPARPLGLVTILSHRQQCHDLQASPKYTEVILDSWVEDFADAEWVIWLSDIVIICNPSGVASAF